jgi:amino acid adenylation domain-containing protein
MSPSIHPATPAHASGGGEPSAHWLNAFSTRAKLDPFRRAVVCGDETLTFQELEQCANGIAGMLASQGIGRGDHVGVRLQRSVELIAALLGVLKSGAAYIPLDPTYPEARIATMIASARLEIILVDSGPCIDGVRTLLMKDAVPSPHERSECAMEYPVYAIFTSGSTGLPKAASVYHAGFANLLEWYREELSLGPDDRTLVMSSPSFDLTQKNLFTPLLTGGTLVLDECRAYDITRLLGLVRSHGITLINCTPSAFYPLVDAAAANGYRDLATLRFAVLGGEPISIPRLREWLEHPDCHAEVVNSYGPTECTDICLFHRLHRGNLDDYPFVPLGTEIPNVQVTIRDENLSLLPAGETGELCISGAGVGGGYLYDPSRTTERFVSGIYRTGDLAKQLPCGAFEFRGRVDHQVKVNGFRIELGEIEIALNAHESVREAVVTANDGRLTAHVQGDAGSDELRKYLASRLPSYMIPSEFRSVDGFPLTPNGKVDRKALIDFPSDQSDRSDKSESPLESRVLSLWSEVLGKTVSDPTANFFDLGGSSIHIAVVHVRLRQMTARDFPLTDLFAHPSARAIAAHLTHQPSSASSAAQERARLAKSSFSRFQRPQSR